MGGNRVSVFVNPAAGGSRGLVRARRVAGELADLGWTVELARLTGPGDVADSIRRTRETDTDRIVLVGGDGMIHLALPALVESDFVTGIVPTGTGNDFCRGLGLSSSYGSVVSQSVSDTVNRVDVIELDVTGGVDHGVGGNAKRYAASAVTFGFSGRVNAMANEMRFPLGTSRYTVATIRQLGGLEPISVRLSFDGEPMERRDVTFVAIGNTAYFGGGMKICPDAAHNDGLLDVVVVEQVSAATLVRVLPLVFVGKHTGHESVLVRRCQSLEIVGEEPMWADGEPLGCTSARLSAKSGALRVAGTLA